MGIIETMNKYNTYKLTLKDIEEAQTKVLDDISKTQGHFDLVFGPKE